MDIQDLFNDLRFWCQIYGDKVFICCYDGLEIWLEKYDYSCYYGDPEMWQEKSNYDPSSFIYTINGVQNVESYDEMSHKIEMHGGIDIERSVNLLSERIYSMFSVKSLVCEF